VTQAAFDHCARTSRGKLSRFQTLAPQAVTTVFKRQHLDVGLPPIDKGKPVPAQRVFADRARHSRALRRVGATPARRVEIIAVMVLAPRGAG